MPIIVTPTSAEPATAAAASVAGLAAWQRSADAMRRVLEWPERARRMGASWPSDLPPADGVTGLDARLVAFREIGRAHV